MNTKKTFRITVVIPYYNNANTIYRALTSVQNQIYNPLEIIIVNDASPDWEEGKIIIEQFTELPIKTFSHSENKNGSAARNTGIKNVMGDWIAFLDADDEWTETHLESYILMEPDSEKSLYYCRSLVKSSTMQYELPKKGISREMPVGEYLFCDKEFIPTPSMFLSKILASKIMFNEELRRHQDYDFLLRLERDSVNIVFSTHLGVIVHWENNNTEAKGGTYEYSYSWARANRDLFTKKSFGCFINKFVVFPLLQKRKVVKGLRVFFEDGRIFQNTFKEYYFLMSMILFGEIKLPWKR
ncbi:glycosyltransferase family 2 protein [Sulfurovum sp.]|uniref:glycosyltransferase family 2 protein n=1 Tax=Sulfurovum sp. TaxID=1969726 RepID=UPI00356A8305